MRLAVVRHACAGHKGDWDGPDEERPLDDVGRTQADALADLFAERTVARIASSPTVRCVDSLVPLARRLGLPVEETDLLTADAGADGLRSLFTDPTYADAVVCTHGELMRPLLRALRSEGTEIVAARTDDDEWLVTKGTAWLLDLSGSGHAERLEHHVPPAFLPCERHPVSPV